MTTSNPTPTTMSKPTSPDFRALCAEQLPELRGMFERILYIARSSDAPAIGNIQLADRLIDSVVSWSENSPSQPEPEGVTDEELVELDDSSREAVHAAVAEALGDVYDCLRVWDAWSYGTMGPDDFSLVAEDDDRVAEIADAAINALARPTIQPLAPEPGYEKGYAQEHLARLMRDAIGTETNHNVYIVAAGKILDRPEFAHVARWGTSTIQPVPVPQQEAGQ